VIVGVGAWLYSSNSSQQMTDTMTPPSDNSAPAPSGTTTTPPPAATATPPAQPLKQFTVTGQNFSFSPATLTVNQGDKVSITFKNSGGMHDFRIDEFGVATNVLKSGDQQTVEFTAGQKGTFEYFCSVGNHRAMGMKG